MPNFIVLLDTTLKFQGPPLIKALTEAYSEPVGAWASDRSFAMLLEADTSAIYLHNFIGNNSANVKHVTVIELGTDWCMTRRENNIAGWLSSHLKSHFARR